MLNNLVACIAGGDYTPLTKPGWEQSVGVQAELALARELGLKIGSIIPGREEVCR